MGDMEIISDRRTVWVNASDGCCIGRFGRNGIDIHRNFREQSTEGECLDCKPGKVTKDSWQRFKEGMLKFHGVKIADRHMPKGIKP